MRLRSIALGAALSLVWCRDPTEITLVVTSDAECARLGETNVSTAETPQDLGGTSRATTRQCTNTASGADVGTLVLVPSGDRGGRVAVRVAATIDGKGVAATRLLRYLPHASLSMPIVLEASCAGVACPVEETCRSGQCVSAVVDPGACEQGSCDVPTVTTSDSGPPSDGSTGDGPISVDGAGPSDAPPDGAEAGPCKPIGQMCATSADCCAGSACTPSPPIRTCKACLPTGSACDPANDQCCTACAVFGGKSTCE